MTTDVERGQVDEHGAQEGESDADRTDHEVLPGCFERSLGPAVPDEEGRDDSRGFDGDPQDTEIGGKDGEQHGGDERLDQDAVPDGRALGCLLYTSDAADDLLCVDLGGRRIIKKKK